MRRFLIAGNWKMNTTRESGVALAGELAAVPAKAESGVEVLVSDYCHACDVFCGN